MGRRMKRPWDRQKDEGAKAYEAFCEYCKAAPQDRVYEKIAKLTRKAKQTILEWASAHDWKARSREWDTALHQKAFKMLAARAAKRDIKRYEDRLKEEVWASSQLPRVRKELLKILDSPKSGPRAILGALDRIRSMAHLDELDLAKLKEEKDGSRIMIHALKRVLNRLSDDDAEALRGIIAKVSEHE